LPARSSPTLRRRRLGSELRRLREAAGVSIDQAAAYLDCSGSKISRLETAQVSATIRDVRDLIELYGVSHEQRDGLLQLAREARQKAWWHAYGGIPSITTFVSLEVASSLIRTYEASVVPGLLQVEEYARTVIRTALPIPSPEETERRVELRMKRQPLLIDDDPPVFWSILDEAVLRRVVGDRSIMRKQLQRLIEVADLPNVTVLILPFAAGCHVSMSGAFTILNFLDSEDHDLVYLEHTAGDLYLESVEQVHRHIEMFDHLRALALTQSASMDLLIALVRDV
jgi:transcriptional regulator with XRE-family HTH domain